MQTIRIITSKSCFDKKARAGYSVTQTCKDGWRLEGRLTFSVHPKDTYSTLHKKFAQHAELLRQEKTFVTPNLIKRAALNTFKRLKANAQRARF